MNRLYLSLLFLSFSLLGCGSLRNEVDPSLLGIEPSKLVITGYLSPQDTLLAVKVTRSATVVGDSISLLETGNNVTDATVTISEGDRLIALQYNNLRGSGDSIRTYYSANAQQFPIVTGHTYTLTVVTANGQRATSTCTIPQAVPLTRIDSLVQNSDRRYSVQAVWQDPAGQANYYQVAGIFRYIDNCLTCQKEETSTLSFDDDLRGLLNDVNYDGLSIPSGRAYLNHSGVSAGNGQTDFYQQYKSASVTINLMSVEQSYYQFQEAVIRQRRSRGNPFAEPVLIPSNINGGLGCFAGYNNSTLTRQLN